MYKSLKNKNFCNLLIGQAISQFGDSGYYFMFIFLINKITKSSTMVGYMGALETLPFLILGPFAGVIADRIDRKKIMLSADLFSTSILIFLGLATFGSSNPSLLLLFGAATILSVINTFFSPAKGASLPSLIDKEYLIEANSLSNAVQSMMPLFGTSVIGTLSAYMMDNTPEHCFSIICGFNALTFLVSAFFIRLLPKLEPQKENEKTTSIIKDSIEGIKYILHTPIIHVILITQSIITFFSYPISLVFLKINQLWFNGNPKILSYGYTGLFIGMLTSSLIVSKIKIKRLAPYSISATIVYVIGTTALAFCKQIELLPLITFIIGIPFSFIRTPAYSYIQHITKDEFRGRINSLINTITLGIAPLSMVMIGRILDILKIEYTFLLMGIGTLLSVIIMFLNPDFRKATFQTNHS